MMAIQIAWVLTCMSLVARTQAAICQNWNEELCEQRNDGGCGCVWNATASKGGECIKGDKCEEGMMGITSVGGATGGEGTMGITSVVEPEPVEMYYNLSSPNSPAQELSLPCMACRRGLNAEEEKERAACEKAGGKVALCKCFDIFCTVKVPADELSKADDKATKDAPSEKTPTEAPKGPVVDETTTNKAETTANSAESVTAQSTMMSNPANIMLFCGALALSF